MPQPQNEPRGESVKVPGASRLRVRWLVAVLAVATAAFIALTVAVTAGSTLVLDSRAFRVADQLRAPWLDHAARLITTLGLLAVVGPAVVIGAAFLRRWRHPARATGLVAGAVLTSISVWITKVAVDRARPPESLVHTAGQSYPSAHAANSVGWLALAIALTAVIPTRAGRLSAIAAGAVGTVVVSLSRIYLRAHYLCDVLAGQALATAMYAAASLSVLAWQASRRPDR